MALDLKASLAALYLNLQQAANHGVVPHAAFEAETAQLALDDTARARLISALFQLGLRLEAPIVQFSTIDDKREVKKVVQSRTESTQTEERARPRVRTALDLLARYADEGAVTERALAGVARLAGLTVSETVELRTGAESRFTVVVGAERHERPFKPERAEPAPPAPTVRGAASTEGDLARAVSAARAVIDEDRYTMRPGKRILTALEEVGLGVLLRGGRDRIDVEPTVEELGELPATHIRRRARDCLVVHNQGLVHSIVRSYVEQGLEYEDLFQHGVLGLINAARKFDPEHGNKFSTYATWWVRQSVTRAVADEGSAIRIPVYMHDLVHKVARAERELMAAGRSRRAADVAVACDLPVSKVEEIRRTSKVTDSLDRIIGDGTHLGELLEVRTALPPVEDTVVASLYTQHFLRVMDHLSARSARIVVRRTGLDGDEPATLDELGREFGVTRERIRQLEGKAFIVLRHLVRHHGRHEEASTPRRRRARALPVEGPKGDGNRPKRVAYDTSQSAERTVRTSGEVKTSDAELMQQTAEPSPADALSTAGADQETTRPALPATSRTSDVPPSPVIPFPRGGMPDADRHEAPPSAGPGPTSSESAGDAPSTEVSARRVAIQTTDSGTEPHGNSDTAGHELYSARWEEAVALSVTLNRSVRWMAHYVHLALGHVLLGEMLGLYPALTIAKVAGGSQLPDRPVTQAIETLVRVLDNLKEKGLRPQDFFECPSPALLGRSPRVYLARNPLVKPEGRLALSQALKEFVPSSGRGGTDVGADVRNAEGPAAATEPQAPSLDEAALDEALEDPQESAGTSTATDGASVHPASVIPDTPEPESPEPTEPNAVEPTTAEAIGDSRLGKTALTEARAAAAEAGRRLQELQAAVADRIAHARAEERNRARVEAQAEAYEAAQRIHALAGTVTEQVACARAEERNRARAEARAEASQQIDRVRRDAERLVHEAHAAADEHAREAQAAAAHAAAEREERALRRMEEEFALRAREIADAANRRVAALEARLQQAEAAFAERVGAAQAVEQEADERVRAVEQWAQTRIAEVEQAARSRIAELEAQLTPARPAAPPPPVGPRGPDPRRRWRLG
ncbi:sigma-70 family RNA polymerase sigma factor [Streptomyces sp. NPDC002889]|uniref:sigma-70 family RNA polymerase sigma factor n=1 Tax=Streptomyces sp. NPDC002889 TaxID=3364669 RepID=UPI0036AFA023